MKYFSHWYRKICKLIALIVIVLGITAGCTRKKPSFEDISMAADTTGTDTGFSAEVNFLKRFTSIILLEETTGKGKVALSPALQGRVMTSTSDGNNGFSYGWINRQAFLSGDTSEHMNAFGGEDRFWLGPEGGQFSIYFEKGKPFSLDNWHVPKLIDLEPFNVVAATSTEAVFTKEATLVNYSGTVFRLGIERKVRLIEKKEALSNLGIDTTNEVSLIAYESINTLKNTGREPWKKQTGLLSVWILGMFNPSENTTIIVPYRAKVNSVHEGLNDSYFGKVPEDRLKLAGNVIYFKGDGKYRSKIGLSPTVAPQWLGSYDADNGVLTLVKYTKPGNAKDYVNSLWEIQKEPYGGDAINAYNDGPPSPGAKPLGPFYELETSSPAAALPPEGTLTHVHTTYHLKGTPEQLDPVMLKLLGTSSKEVTSAFKK